MLKVGDMKIRAQNKIIRNGKVDLCQNMYKVSENKKNILDFHSDFGWSRI